MRRRSAAVLGGGRGGGGGSDTVLTVVQLVLLLLEVVSLMGVARGLATPTDSTALNVILGGEALTGASALRRQRPPTPAAVAAPVTDAPSEWAGVDTSDLPPPVHFITDNSSVVTAQTGSTAHVPCVVSNLGDGMVSWIRRKDYHLLTVGLVTYTGDERYQAIHVQHSEDWTLQIKYVQERDAGLYECQVSSHPPTSIFIDLRVVEARAEIAGPSEKYLKLGSALRLVCTLRQSTEPPVYVFWYHNNRMVNYDGDRGINVTTERAAKTSTLYVSSATRDHSGNYSCVPNNAQPASTYVHILNGENPAAMQHGGRALSWLRCPSAWLLLASITATLSSGRSSWFSFEP